MPPAPTPATMPGHRVGGEGGDAGCPRARHSPIALTTAPGAVGCSDRNASAMNTNGISASPNAIAAAGLATPPSSSERAGDEPGQHRPVGGHQHERRDGDRPPLPLGRQRFDPRAGGVTAASSLHRTRRQPPHEVPLEREEHEQRERHGDERRGRQQVPVLAAGADERRRGRSSATRFSLGAPEEHVRDEQVVPHPEELEDGERRERRHRQRDDQPPEDREVVGAVDPAPTR